MYGLRVAWCVFGDVKDALAKDIFVTGSQAAGYSETEHVEVAQSDALTPPPRSRLRREQSFVWDVQGPLIVIPDLISNDAVDAGHFDNLDSDTDSDSEYSDASDEEDTESAESDDLDLDLSLDDEEEVQRDIMALLSHSGLDEHDGDKTMDGNSLWDMTSFMVSDDFTFQLAVWSNTWDIFSYEFLYHVEISHHNLDDFMTLGLIMP